MSTYYSLVCDRCKEETSLVSHGMTTGWMAGADKNVPAFMAKHLECGPGNTLRVVSEHEDEYGSYTEFADP